MNQSNKPFGMYNSSNPMINGATKEEINLLLESYFNDKSSVIQNDICEIANKQLNTLIEYQSEKIANMRESLRDIYSAFLSKVESDDILPLFRSNSISMNQECISLKSTFDKYEYQIKAINKNSRDIPDIDAMIDEVYYLIQSIKSNAVMLDKKTEKSFEAIDLNNVYNDLNHRINQIHNGLQISTKKTVENDDSMITKATISISEAQRKLKAVKSSSDSHIQSNEIHSIKQFKRRNIF